MAGSGLPLGAPVQDMHVLISAHIPGQPGALQNNHALMIMIHSLGTWPLRFQFFTACDMLPGP